MQRAALSPWVAAGRSRQWYLVSQPVRSAGSTRRKQIRKRTRCRRSAKKRGARYAESKSGAKQSARREHAANGKPRTLPSDMYPFLPRPIADLVAWISPEAGGGAWSASPARPPTAARKTRTREGARYRRLARRRGQAKVQV